jgi:hypothetical protein
MCGSKYLNEWRVVMPAAAFVWVCRPLSASLGCVMVIEMRGLRSGARDSVLIKSRLMVSDLSRTVAYGVGSGEPA